MVMNTICRSIISIGKEFTSMNARQSERKSPDSFSLSIRVVLYLSRESETACNPLINS